MSKQSSSEPDDRILAMLRKAEPRALLIVVTIAVLTLGLWFAPRLAALLPPIWSKMVPNSAVGMLCAAGSLALSAERCSPRLWRLSRAAGLAVLVLGILTLVEYAADISSGIDAWLPADYAARYPLRPSPQTSVGFVLLGTGLLVMRDYKNARSLLADMSAIAIVAFCLVMIAGHVYGALNLVGLGSSNFLSPQTLFCFSCLAFVVVARRAKHGGLFAVLVSIGIGSHIVRFVLPSVIVLPFALFGAVMYLINSHAMQAPYVYALAAAAASFFVLGAIVWMAWQINALERQLRELSLQDELTKLFNRRGFYVLAQQAFRDAARANTGMTVLFFDIDGLKRANDTAGHAVGSELIQVFASLLVGTFRESDIVGRIGGDEFAVSTLRDRGQAREALARLEQSVADFNTSDAQPFPLSFSAGTAEIINGSSENFDALIARADSSMYRHKVAKQSRGRSVERHRDIIDSLGARDRVEGAGVPQ
jgi:diguanylate cyclase (GGDEF)-like protein